MFAKPFIVVDPSSSLRSSFNHDIQRNSRAKGNVECAAEYGLMVASDSTENPTSCKGAFPSANGA